MDAAGKCRFLRIIEGSMFIGCSTNGFYPQLDNRAALAEIGKLGFTHAELMLYHHHQYTPGSFRSVKEAADAAGVAIDVIHLEPDEHLPFDPDPAVVADAWHNFDRAIAGAHQIGAHTVVWQGPMRVEYPVDSGFDPLLEVIYEIDRRCEPAGIRLALENTSTMILSTVRDFMEIGPRLPERVGFAFDPHHAAAAGANPMLLLRQMHGRLFDAHLRDFDEDGNRTGNILPGDGTLPWPAILRAIRGAGFDGPLMLEAVLQPDPARSVAAVRALLVPLIANINDGEVNCGSVPPPGVLEGIRLFNEGLYYECHEEIEHEWHAETGEMRNLYQGILQIGVGFHHASNGNLRGARLLLTDGLDKLSSFLPTCMGIDTQALWDESSNVLDDIERRLTTRRPAPLVLVFPTIQVA
jgi:sugar phosphate isomerase/epimerase